MDQEVDTLLTPRTIMIVFALVVLCGCAVTQRVERPEGPFEVVLFATTDTRGELEPCG